jgi:hypothetical protein
MNFTGKRTINCPEIVSAPKLTSKNNFFELRLNIYSFANELSTPAINMAEQEKGVVQYNNISLSGKGNVSGKSDPRNERFC